MRRLFYIAGMALLLSWPALAQDTPKAEIFGGYSYGGEATHGWNTAVAGNVNKWFGLEGELSGLYTNIREADSEENIRTHSFLFGPRISMRRSKRVTPFVHALLGTAHLRTRAMEQGQAFSFSDTSFGMSFGGGLDVRVSDHIAIRVIQIDYVRTHFFDETQNKGRISAGIVFRFGKK